MKRLVGIRLRRNARDLTVEAVARQGIARHSESEIRNGPLTTKLGVVYYELGTSQFSARRYRDCVWPEVSGMNVGRAR
jgi:hypothetical protein